MIAVAGCGTAAEPRAPLAVKLDSRGPYLILATREAETFYAAAIAAAVQGEVSVPGKLIDNLGPNTQAGKHDFHQSPGSFFLASFAGRFGLETISHGGEAFDEGRLKSMDSAGVLHFGGHGHPDRVDDGLRGTQACQLALAPCVAFNGACYTGVTGRWFEQWTPDGKVAERVAEAGDCFCLNLLTNQVLAYLAALHPDHGIPVYQEMEYLAYSGESLGDVMKHTHDGVVLGSAGKLPQFEPLVDGSPSPQWTPSDVMLKGTATRILFGDPALIVGDAFVKAPFEVAADDHEGALNVTGTLSNAELKSSFTDTYHADLAWDPNGFNDRALINVDLPEGWDEVGGVEVISVEARGKSLRSRLVGYGLERDGDLRRLHVQVDVPTEGYMQSKLRVAGAKLVLRAAP